MASSNTTPTRADRRRTATSRQATALLRDAPAGNSDAFAAPYSIYRDLITRRVRVNDRSAVDDLVHDAFTDALARLATADAVSWLPRLAAHACQRRLWTNRRRTRAALQPHAQPFAPAPDTQRISLIAAAPLTDQQRQALLVRLDGYARDVAATEMGRTGNEVRWWEAEAVRRLRGIADGAP